MNDLFLPLAGYRNRETGMLSSQDSGARYRASTPNNASTSAHALLFNSTSLQPQSSYGRSYGFSVRCFKNDIKNEVCSKITDIPRDECEALVDFYYSTNGDEWINGSGGAITQPRLTGSLVCSRWYGVTCGGTPRQVVRIRIPDNNLKGTLNSSLSVLTGMTEFRVFSNQLTGVLPPEYSAWSEITDFRVNHNQLTGTLPPEYSAWSKMRIFYVQVNQLN